MVSVSAVIVVSERCQLEKTTRQPDTFPAYISCLCGASHTVWGRGVPDAPGSHEGRDKYTEMMYVINVR